MIKDLAQRTIDSYSDKNVKFDPMTLLLLASVFIEVVKLIKQCREPKEIYKCATLPTNKEYRMISKAVRRKIGWRRWFKEGRQITDAVFKTGMISTTGEIQEAYDEVI